MYFRNRTLVVPAKAHCCLGKLESLPAASPPRRRDPAPALQAFDIFAKSWIPAYAGMTSGHLRAGPTAVELSALPIWLAAATHVAEPTMVGDFPGQQCAKAGIQLLVLPVPKATHPSFAGTTRRG